MSGLVFRNKQKTISITLFYFIITLQFYSPLDLNSAG
jgi:hypothetical protein